MPFYFKNFVTLATSRKQRVVNMQMLQITDAILAVIF